MELKFETPVTAAMPAVLLIEPCGIEIRQQCIIREDDDRLLIEPCGIEIVAAGHLVDGSPLLIEPCGIEIE